jgi:predicted ABC-class ATPase
VGRGGVGALRALLEQIDGRGYPAYKDLRGEWELPVAGVVCTLVVDHVQGDPFAAPSRMRLRLPSGLTGLPLEECRPGPRALGVAALLARTFARVALQGTAGERGGGGRRGSGGSGGSGVIRMVSPGQQVLDQSATRILPDGGVEARFTVGLPAAGRRILGKAAVRLLLEQLPSVVTSSLVAGAHDAPSLRLHARTNEDAEVLRSQLGPLGLVAFVADGAHLPRRSGVDDRPMEGGEVIPFRSPDSLRVTLRLASGEPVEGMGIPVGVTLIVGGGYHGKSTLLRAVERGVYNHRPGDGRERVVTDASAVKVRAEDGRSVAGVDLSLFIRELPGGRDTRRFSTADASGSTSQAAAMVEALEAGAGALLVDEDTAATNLMIRDRRMQALVPRESEPITPFIDRTRQLHRERGVSSVLVLGGSGDYLDVADTVVAMVDYLPMDVTEQAREVAGRFPTGRLVEAPATPPPPPDRVPQAASVDPSRGRKAVAIKVRGANTVLFGEEEIDLSAVEQIVSTTQTRAIGEALHLARERLMDGRSIPAILDALMELLHTEGLDALGRGTEGDLALFRRFEFAAALNRLRGLELTP